MTHSLNPGATSSSWNIEVRLAMNAEEMAMVMAIRAAVFLGEEDDITYADEFDGNDFVATHFIAFVNGDPAGVIRLRWFNGFASMERLGIRKRYRSYKVFAALARKAIEHARCKGYHLITGHPRGDVTKLWSRFNGRQSGPPIEMFRGVLTPTLIEVEQRAENVIPVGPFGDAGYEDLITQVEGQWDFTLLQAKHQQAAE